MKKKVLVFPCGTEIGLEVNKSLQNSKQFEVYGASSEKSNHGKYVFKNYISELPYIDDEKFIERLNKVIDENKIDFIYPTHDSVLLELSKMKEKINCDVIASKYDTCKICRHKSQTYEKFEKILRTPKVYSTMDEVLHFPVFLKPDVGQGSQNTYKVDSREEAEFYLKKNNNLIILEYLPGKEYTIDCFTDKDGNLKYVQARERKRIRNGISVSTNIVHKTEFIEIAEKINKNLEIRGAWFFQVKQNMMDKLTLLEIEPRIAGSMAIDRCLGINLPLITLFDFCNINIEIIKNKFNIYLDRALCNKYKIDIEYNNIFVDLDDTIIVDNKINVNLIMFLHQGINENKRIVLITKHLKHELKQYLKKYRIYELFDEIITINNDDEKYNYINENDSIFIDDSYIERKKIYYNIGIPIFDVDSIECLIK